jgi:hypothetical protein
MAYVHCLTCGFRRTFPTRKEAEAVMAAHGAAHPNHSVEVGEGS